jgi:hypothetical protein
MCRLFLGGAARVVGVIFLCLCPERTVRIRIMWLMAGVGAAAAAAAATSSSIVWK